MKKLISILSLATSLFAFDYQLKPTKINENTWCFLGHVAMPNKTNGGFMSNNCFIQTSESYIVIDSGGTYEYAKQAYETMKKIKDLPVKSVIATHDHDDHWLGNSYYKEVHHATLYGPTTINANHPVGTKTRLMTMLPQEITKGTKIVPIDKEVTEDLSIEEGGVKVMMILFDMKAHTAKDMFVYVPSTKTIFSGDTVMNERITSNRDGSVIGQIKAHQKMDDQGWINLVPGHGHDTSKTAMDESKLYFKLLKERVMNAIEEDVGADEAHHHVHLNEFKDKVMFDTWNKRNIFDAYSELEFHEEE